MDDPGLIADFAPASTFSDAPPPPSPPAVEPPAARSLVDLDRPTWQLVLALTWPGLLQQLLLLLVTLSDRFLAGNFRVLSPELHVAAQAAQTTAGYLGWFISSYTVLVSAGSTALVARLVGAGDRSRAIHATNQALLLAAVFGLGGTFAGLACLSPLVHLLQLQGPTAELAVAYLVPMFGLLVFQVIEMGGIACLAGAGDMRTGLCVLGGVAVLNLPLSWGFYLGIRPFPQLGFPGIALGTALSHTIGCLAVLLVLRRGRAGLRLVPHLLRPDRSLLARLLRVSLPAGADSLSVAVGQLWFVSIVNGLGDVAEAAHGIALGWEALGYLAGVAFGTAAMTLVGQYLGAGRPDRAARAGWTAFAQALAVMTFMGTLFYLLAPAMFRLFCKHSWQQPIIDAGVPVLRLVAFAMPAVASCIIFTCSLRGAGDTRIPVLFTWLGFFCVRIPLAYLLTRSHLDLGPLGTWPAFNLGLIGAWLAMFADLLVRGVFFLLRFASGRWQHVRI